MKGKLILSVEDEEDIQQLVSYNLMKAGYQVICAESGEEALEKLGTEKPDLIILDLMLPGMNGLEVCKHIKKTDSLKNIPVVMLTAKSEEVDIITGLEIGADDYITKPFSPKILIARIKNALRRRAEEKTKEKDISEDSIVVRGAIVMDPGRFETKVNGQTVSLTLTEFSILKILVRRPGWVFSREQIIDSVRGFDYSVTPRAVDVHIFSLRKKLGPAGMQIEAVRGIGYRFKEDA
nr:response regulator transcription factor [Desulfobulbaceae bacterium]